MFGKSFALAAVVSLALSGTLRAGALDVGDDLQNPTKCSPEMSKTRFDFEFLTAYGNADEATRKAKKPLYDLVMSAYAGMKLPADQLVMVLEQKVAENSRICGH